MDIPVNTALLIYWKRHNLPWHVPSYRTDLNAPRSQASNSHVTKALKWLKTEEVIFLEPEKTLYWVSRYDNERLPLYFLTNRNDNSFYSRTKTLNRPRTKMLRDNIMLVIFTNRCTIIMEWFIAMITTKDMLWNIGHSSWCCASAPLPLPSILAKLLVLFSTRMVDPFPVLLLLRNPLTWRVHEHKCPLEMAAFHSAYCRQAITL